MINYDSDNLLTVTSSDKNFCLLKQSGDIFMRSRTHNLLYATFQVFLIQHNKLFMFNYKHRLLHDMSILCYYNLKHTLHASLRSLVKIRPFNVQEKALDMRHCNS